MASEPLEMHQDLTNAYERIQRAFGKPPVPAFGAGSLRLRFDSVNRDGKELGDILAEAGARIEVRVKAPVGNGMEDMLIGRIEDKAFMASGVESKGGEYAVEIHIYLTDSKQAMVGADALFLMLDALLQAHTVPPDALPGYLAYRLGKDKPKDARRLAAEISGVVTDFLSK